MNKNILETLVGLVVVVTAVTFGFNAYNSTNKTQTDDNSYSLNINFDRADGINNGGDVMISGLKIGKIVSTNLNQETYQANVKISLDNNIKIPEDSSAEIISAGLLGDKYVAIVPGGSEEFLQDGELIKYAQSSVSLEGLIGKFMFGSSDEEAASDEDSSNDIF